ncbi:MAG: hypothetical protein ABIN74_03320 [Ferruginibacter sp.]
MKSFLPLLLLISINSFSQSADFIQLKKHNKTITTFYSGGNIAFTAESGAYIDAVINGIKNDTLYLQQFIIRYLPTTIGTYIIDTVGSYHYKYNYRQITAIGEKEKTKFNVRGSGAALLGGGALLTLASGVVYVADREKFSAPLLLASVGLGTLGYFMARGKKGGGGMLIGKKYKLVYMNMSNKKD